MVVGHGHEALVDQLRDLVQDVPAGRPVRDADGLELVRSAAADEDGELGEQRLRGGIEQVKAPGNRVLERPLPGRDVEVGGAGQGQPVRQAVADTGHTEQGDPGSRQLDPEWKAIEPTTDVDRRLRVLGGQGERRLGSPDAIHEQPDRGNASDLIGDRSATCLRYRQRAEGKDPARPRAAAALGWSRSP